MSEQIKCFLVDDDRDDQEIFLMAALETQEHINCTFAINGQEAVNKLTNPAFVPDIIFMDMNMPGMSGRQCLAMIKKIPRLKKVPVIIFSTSIERKEELELRLLGAKEFIPKPSSIPELTALLKSRFAGLRTQPVNAAV